MEEISPKLRMLAVKTASVVGDGLYGLDIKEKDGKFYIIEVNDNPSIDGGIEDRIIKNQLYEEIMRVFIKRLDRKTKGYTE